jgi:hypothetical protein
MSETHDSKRQQELWQLAQRAQIKELRPLNFAAALHGSWPGPEVSVTAEITRELRVHLEPSGFVVVGRFTCQVLRAEGAPRDPVATFRYEALCAYDSGKEEIAPELVELYARTNAMVHLWPYFRHFVQTSSAQLNILPILLPAFRANASEEDWERSEQQSSLQEPRRR